MMKVTVVNCEAPTVEKKELVDTQAPTVEKVNPAQTTKPRPTFLTLKYRMSDPNPQIIPFLPKKNIQKLYGEPLKFGRTENFDVFFNDLCMSREYAHVYAERNYPSQFKVVNLSSSKAVIVDGEKLMHKETCYIKDKSVLEFDMITFFVSLQPGDTNAEGYVVNILPEINQQLCRAPSPQVQNFGNCNPTCCCTPVNVQIQHVQSCPQIHPQIHNCSNRIPVSSHFYDSSTWSTASPQVANPLNFTPVFPSTNKIQSTHRSSEGNESSRRQPQEHSMPSADAFCTEKERQSEFIEDQSRKSSF